MIGIIGMIIITTVNMTCIGDCSYQNSDSHIYSMDSNLTIMVENGSVKYAGNAGEEIIYDKNDLAKNFKVVRGIKNPSSTYPSFDKGGFLMLDMDNKDIFC
jgi:hypothetical protein